ncbi:MAG: class IV adenylate cyclase [Spirochaetia bacterium]|nr:class IV adenylate cyclase [Spirochaetia bacterium]
MAIEVEIKAWVQEVDHLREKILAIAEFQNSYEKRDTYFSWPQQEKPLFRIRREAGTNTVNYKQKERAEGIEVNREHEFQVDDAEAFINFCEYLEYEVYIEKHKQGQLYAFENVGIELSFVEGLGWFIEIEILVNHQSEVSPAREKLREVLQALSVPNDKIEPRYYYELLEEKKHGEQ